MKSRANERGARLAFEPAFCRGWNSGVIAAVNILLSNGHASLPGTLFTAIAPLLASPTTRNRTDAEIAKKYGISKRTVLNWRKDGCPFDQGQWAVLDWMAGRRYLPAKAEQMFKKQLTKRRLRAMLERLDDTIIETRAIGRAYRELGLPVQPWMKIKRVTRRKVAAATA